MKFHPVGSELVHVDRQTDVTKLAVTFHNFANVPKNFKTFCWVFRYMRGFQSIALCGSFHT